MQAVAPRLSVVIPTHNGASRIDALLRALSEQTLTPDAMEVLIIDNASSDTQRTALRESTALAGLGQRLRTSVFHLAEPGLTAARVHGVQESRGEVVFFLDDDAIPSSGCCEAALDSFDAEEVGVAFGRVSPAYSRPPHASIRKREGILAINEALGDQRIVWKSQEFVPTLGVALAVRRAAFLGAYPWQTPHRLLSDRVGSRLISGGDLEIGHFLGQAGWWRLYNPRMSVRHAIDADRLEPRRFCRLIIGIERSRATFEDKFHLGPRPAVRALVALRDAAAITALAPVWIASRDGFPGWVFALASRAGRLMGRYR
jgi:glycosyltransferase involved in cell wall biosynthesis